LNGAILVASRSNLANHLHILFNLLIAVATLIGFAGKGFALGQIQYIETAPGPDSFPLVHQNSAATLCVDSHEWSGVVRAARDLQADVKSVSGCLPAWSQAGTLSERHVVLIGTLGKSALIEQLLRDRKLDVSPIAGQWESFFLQVVPQPWPGVDSALVICGSDQRGTIYGIYDLSGQIGVSPWHYWADVPPQHHPELFVKAGNFRQGPPSVKYRGIFLNDEAPALTGWIQGKYGRAPGWPKAANYGPAFYTNLFEVMLRLNANYLWPAMWNNAFNEDDTNNPALANRYGIVMGTSHQEPMMRAQKEWDRRYQKTLGHWNYVKNPDVMETFWRDGIRRNKNDENIITLGLRGANDTPMATGGPAANQALLEQIVGVQRKLIAAEINPDVTQVPQLWCLYKEVLDYYNAGMRVPDDVTLLWAEDNWGNVRRLPTAEERRRTGGAGVYYHFDYHGDPRSYQWLNTSPIAKIWDQMSLAQQYGADRIWIVNVGHFKGYEFPLEYFLHLAWDPDRWTNENINEFTRLWAAQEFGPAYAGDIADILAEYTKYNGRRKPELLDATTYSLVNYQEFEKVVADFNAIAARAEIISGQLPAAERASFYELVLFPTKASAQLNALYLAAAKNALYARQRRASANDLAAQTRSLFRAETQLLDHYNRTLLDGKWNHFMDQTVIGYTNWADPRKNNLGAIPLTEIKVPSAAAMALTVENSDAVWPGASAAAVLPSFDSFNRPRHYLEVFNQGRTPFAFTAVVSAPWLLLSQTNGTVNKDQRLWVSVDWDHVPHGSVNGEVRLTGTGHTVAVQVKVFNPVAPTRDSLTGFVEADGCVSIEPEHYTRKVDAGDNRWLRVEDYGRTLSGMRTTQPVDAPRAIPGKDSPCLEYRMYLFSTGVVSVAASTSPTLNFIPGRSLQWAASWDDQPAQIVNVVPVGLKAPEARRNWEESVKNNARSTEIQFTLAEPGYHTLKLWMMDPGVLLQKMVVNLGGVKPSYLGPPESFRRN